ncbi:MAG: aminotransferase class III-fold pyridoxal phosphate-dependent enzyme [Ectothiorhodospiraceae bacterium]|nr:aminotransferase class III-fold pyridoxal phosphate-dependent enzyme [Chromatiales bacterium]MCP5156549.1 aminotransferase class III-fold pyridoxal phosphate-dependent enzyme [Ectothiorhodospiraceae bacterium]
MSPTPAERQAELLRDAGQHLAGGGLGLFVLPDDLNLVIDRGEGARVWSVAGREYIDYHLSSGPALLGHAHPAITEAVEGRLSKGTTYYFLNEPEIELARRLADAVPCGDVVHYTGSGTEATFYALRIARAHTGRNKVLKFEGAWHGMHDYGLWGTVPSVPSNYPHARPDSVGVPAETGETVMVTPFNETAQAVDLINRHADEIAAVIVEPLQRVLLPEPGFLEAIREATLRHGIVLIFDEIVTGFRIAWGGAQERYGVIPDMACYGKAVSGGFPLAAIVGKREVMSVLDARSRPREQVVWATNTLNGNPVCAAAGCAALDVLSAPGVYDQLDRIGKRLRDGIVESGRRRGLPIQAPGENMVFGVRFTEREPLRTWQDLTTADKDLGWRWALECLRRGLLVNPNEKFYISIAHTEADIDHTLTLIDEAFAAI